MSGTDETLPRTWAELEFSKENSLISDTEFLDRIVENEDFYPSEDEFDRLIALARIGARVTQLPREIYEAVNAIANLDGDWEGNSCDG